MITSLQTLAAQPAIAMRYAALSRPPPGRARGLRTPRSSRGRSCTSSAAARWRAAGEIPHVPYYGSVDATPLWLILLHETWRWTGDTALVRELLPHAERALEWIDRYGDQDGDGFVEYSRTSAQGAGEPGLEGFGRRRPVPRRPPARSRRSRWSRSRATCTTPSSRMAELFRHLGSRSAGRALRREAAELRNRIRAAFWMEKLGIFALALDGESARFRPPPPTPATCSGAGCRRREIARRLAARLARARFLLGLGRAHAERRARGLQPDELPQRLDLAARQRHPGARHGAARARAGRAADRARAVRGGGALRVPAAARALLRDDAPARRAARSTIR